MTNPSAPQPGLQFPPEYAELIAHVVTTWSNLEFGVNQTIWALADAPQAYGACITSQLTSLHSRLNALVALMRVRGCSDKLISRVNKFAEDVRGAQEKRNRIIHDPWLNSVEWPMILGRIEITAPKKLTISAKSISVDDLKSDLKTIKTCAISFFEIKQSILDELPSLRDKHEIELNPITTLRSGQ
ncbi:MAG: hypothetical protein WAK01_09975 [Methylocystis sp.]